MAKQYISDNNELYLKEQFETLSASVTVPDCFWPYVELFPHAVEVQEFLKNFCNPSTAYVQSADYDLVGTSNFSHMHGKKYSVIMTVQAGLTSNLPPQPPGPYHSKKTWSEMYENFEQIKSYFVELLEFTKTVKKDSIKIHGNVFRLNPQKFIDTAQSLVDTFSNVKIQSLDFKSYKLKYYVNDKISIDTQKPYYLFVGDDGGQFLSLVRTKHGRTMYEWGLASNLEQAFLFTLPPEQYDLPYYAKNLTKVVADIKITGIEGPNNHAKIQEIQSRIEKRDISNFVENAAPTRKTHKL